MSRGALLTPAAALLLAGAACESGPIDPEDGDVPRVVSRTEVSDGGFRPAISGSRVVFRNSDNGLGLHDLVSHSDTVLFTPPGNETFTFRPAISGDRVVWAVLNDDRRTDIRLHDLGTDSTRMLSRTPRTLDVAPDISGDWVVWRFVGPDDVEPDLGVANLAEGTTGRFPCDPEFDELPTLVGDHRVAWSREPRPDAPPDAPLDLALGDLETGDWEPIAPSARQQLQVAADGERLVWVRDDDPGTNIMYMDLDTDEQRQLTDDTLVQREPDISGRFVVWQDGEFRDGDIVVHDLRSGRQTTLTRPDAAGRNPAIDGRWVAWHKSDATGAALVVAEIAP